METMLERKRISEDERQCLIAISNELLNKAQWPRLSINEQRLVLYMLALIEKDDENFKVYRITIKELQNVLATKGTNLYTRFRQATATLMTKIITWIEAPSTQDETFRQVTWCSQSAITKGKGFVELSFDPHLKPFLLGLKGNFTLYELRAVIRLQSHYSLRIYQLLKFNQGRAGYDGRISVRVDIAWLKQYLDIPPDQYKRYNHFKTKVLQPAQKDIAQKTDLLFDFTEHKDSRRIASIEFFWRKNPDYDQMELPFKPPVEHQTTKPQLANEPEISLSPPDEIGNQLQALGFDDWQKIRSRLTDEGWQLALDDLEYNKKKTDRDIKSPGGWLRNRINLARSGTPYKPTQPFQKHLKQQKTKRERTRKQAEREAKRKAEEAQAEAYHRILNERITTKIQSLSKTASRDFGKQAEKKALAQVPHPTPDMTDQLEAARQKLESLSKTEQNKVKRKAKTEIQKHLKETGSTLSLSGRAGIQVLKNRTLQIVIRDYPLESPSEKRYQAQLKQTTERILRDLVRKKYKIVGDGS